MRRNPTTIDARTWFYSDTKALDCVHEVYADGEYKRAARFSIPKTLVDNLYSQADSPDELRALVKYVGAVLLAEYEAMAREKELEDRGRA